MTPRPLNIIDFYKADHRSQYPDGTSLVFTNLTPRSSRMTGITEVIAFGFSYYIERYLIQLWNEEFFQKPKDEVVAAYRRRMTNAGINISYDHVEALHDLGYLPMEIRAVPEGTSVPVGVPMLVMWNTHPDFFWLTNYLETSISEMVWGSCTSATIAKEYRRIFMEAMTEAGGDTSFVDWMGHDFSARGMYANEASILSGAGHLLSFTGTDTVSAIDFLEDYYHADSDKELIGGSVPATEHSVMCMGSEEGELETFRRLICDIYPSGPVSIVSDTWDYWDVWTSHLPKLHDQIMAREGGPVIIRPDSGDPVKIICGDGNDPAETPSNLGTFELAWRGFGGSTNDKGFRQLDPHIATIYGDSITLDRAYSIVSGLVQKRFVPQMVFGIGSYTYQMNTRDTFGFAMKATYGEVNGEPREIFKDPVTDKGDKKSAKGLLAVEVDDETGKLVLRQQVDWDRVLGDNCLFEQRFHNGAHLNQPTLAEVRARVKG